MNPRQHGVSRGGCRTRKGADKPDEERKEDMRRKMRRMRRRVALGSTCQQRKGSKRDVHEEGETSTDELASECQAKAGKNAAARAL